VTRRGELVSYGASACVGRFRSRIADSQHEASDHIGTVLPVFLVWTHRVTLYRPA